MGPDDVFIVVFFLLILALWLDCEEDSARRRRHVLPCPTNEALTLGVFEKLTANFVAVVEQETQEKDVVVLPLLQQVLACASRARHLAARRTGL